ncbi:MAG: hypothetical protein LC104_14910 [Bacteroidales bacterium]|nr:hypothetical protein [Bacteroidales bacterium]
MGTISLGWRCVWGSLLGAASLSGVAWAIDPAPVVPQPSAPIVAWESTAPAGEAPVGETPAGPVGPPFLEGPLHPVPAPAPPGQPPLLDRPIGPDDLKPISEPGPTFTRTLIDPTTGYSGPSGVLPTIHSTADYVPMPDRWRIGYPEWDRYDRGQPVLDQYPYTLGTYFDPYNQNRLKGDYPVIGQHTFFNFTGTLLSLNQYANIPTQTTPFESTARPFTNEFFGKNNNYFTSNFLFTSFDLFHGDAAFKPNDWRFRLTPVFNMNSLSVSELAVVSPNVLEGATRNRTWFALQEFFADFKIADTSSEYDFVSARFGSQPFVSDFRGFIYADTNLMARVYGTRRGNKEQFNLVYTEQFEKDTFSGLNTFHDRHQNVTIANYFVQDFYFPGYTLLANVHYNDDQPSTRYDRAGFLVRPDPTGVFQQHRVQTVYLGLGGDGHIGRFNVNHMAYWVVGRDSLNPIGNQEQDVSAQFAAMEVSYDRDWIRFRASGAYSSGDGNANNSRATGFDTIMANPVFAGGEFSYFQRNGLPLFGVQTVGRLQLTPNLRSSPIQGQANYVNPGLWLVNGGMDLEITPRLRSINNVNFLWFDKTNALETFLFQPGIDREIGTDLSTGLEYRPLLNNQMVFLAGAAVLIPASGFQALYQRLDRNVNPLASVFVEAVFQY